MNLRIICNISTASKQPARANSNGKQFIYRSIG